MGVNQHVPADQDDSPKLFGPKVALAFGVVASVPALILAGWALTRIVGVTVQLIPILIGLALIGMNIEFWVTRAWKDGFTIKELILTVAWPIDVFYRVRDGLRERNAPSQPADESGFEAVFDAGPDETKTLLKERHALIFGVVLTLSNFGSNLHFLRGIFGVSIQVALLFLAIWAVVFVLYFWITKSWKDGLTVQELMFVILWPIDILKIVWRSATPLFGYNNPSKNP